MGSEMCIRDSNNSSILEIIGRIFAWLLYFIATSLGRIFILIAGVMIKIATYNNFLNEPAIVSGWKILRDICNNFFIILLILTAIMTMLRQGEFKDWRNILPKILIASVLINFSLLMCGILIDISQVFTLTFASPLNSNLGYNIILGAMNLPANLDLSGASQVLNKEQNQQSEITTFDLIVALFYAIIVTIVALVVVIAITVILGFRIVYLWFLIILSPLTFILSVFRRGESYVKQWWEEFIKYLIVGPIIMFFLYISFLNMGTMNRGWITEADSVSSQSENQKKAFDTIGLSKAATPSGVINFVIVVGLLVGSLIMGQKIGVKGSAFAGQSLNWLQKQGKRWSGLNLAAKTPGALLTATDDKFGIRQKFYGATFAAGGRFVPFLREPLGNKIGSLEEQTQKRINNKYSALAKGYQVDKLTEDQLRKLALKIGKNRNVVAIQELMKRGAIKDNDNINRSNNIEIIKKARKALSGTSLGHVFDENLKKYNPSLAYSTIYDREIDKLRGDLKTGKIDINNLMANMTPDQINKLKADLGGSDGAVAKFIIDNSNDIGKTISGMNNQSKKLVTDEIDHKVFAKRMNNNGTVAEYDEETRKKYLSSRPTDINKAFDMSNDTEVEKARKYFSKNKETVLKEMDPKEMNQEFIKNFGDLFDYKELEKNFSSRSDEHKSAAAAALQSHLDASLNTLNFDQLAKNLQNAIASGDSKAIENAKKEQVYMDELVKKNFLVQGNLSPSVINSPGSDIALQRIFGNFNGDDASKINWGKLSDQEKDIISKNINPNALRALAARGDNNELIKEVRDRVKSMAAPDNNNESQFNDAKQKFIKAQEKVDAIKEKIKQYNNEAVDARAAGDNITYQKLQSALARLRSEEIALQSSLTLAQTEYEKIKLSLNGGKDNWEKTDIQKREEEIARKK